MARRLGVLAISRPCTPVTARCSHLAKRLPIRGEQAGKVLPSLARSGFWDCLRWFGMASRTSSASSARAKASRWATVASVILRRHDTVACYACHACPAAIVVVSVSMPWTLVKKAFAALYTHINPSMRRRRMLPKPRSRSNHQLPVEARRLRLL